MIDFIFHVVGGWLIAVGFGLCAGQLIWILIHGGRKP